MRATPSLRELQERFAAAVYEDDGAVNAHVRADGFSATRRLQIYRRNTFATLTDALAADYPVVRRLVGEGFFEFAADSYLRRYPQRSGNLHDFGARFTEFFAEFAPAQSAPYLPDVARLEWARQEAYHAARAAPLALAALAAIPPEKYGAIVFQLHPSARLVTSTYPILQIWLANQPGAAEQIVNLDDGAQRVLVARTATDVTMTELGVGEFEWLRVIAESKPLVVANDAALAADPDFDLTQILQADVASQTIVSLRLE